MFNRITLLAIPSVLVLSLAACSTEAPQPAASQPAAAADSAPAPKPEPEGPYYELTKDDITSHPDWTSRNITVLGAKLGDKTTTVEKNFGTMDNTRTLDQDYLTVYQKNGLMVYTFKSNGKARKIEVNETFADKVADPKLKKLLTSNDPKTMQEVLGMEEGPAVENADNMSTEHIYDSRGIRFVQYKVAGKTINALRFQEIPKK